MLFGTVFGFTTSAGALYQAHWIGLAVTGAGLLLTTAMLSWSAQNRRGYGPALLAATAAPLLLANPAVALLEDFGYMHRQLFALKEQVMMLTVMGEVSLFTVSPCRNLRRLTRARRAMRSLLNCAMLSGGRVERELGSEAVRQISAL